MARIVRGDILWADLEPVKGHEQAGRRPVLVLSHEEFNAKSGTVIAMAITSAPQRAGFPLTYPVPAKLLPQESSIKISQIRTLSTKRLGKRLGRLAPAHLEQVVEGLLEIIDG